MKESRPITDLQVNATTVRLTGERASTKVKDSRADQHITAHRTMAVISATSTSSNSTSSPSGMPRRFMTLKDRELLVSKGSARTSV